MDDTGLRDWLAGLDEDGLVRLFRERPELVVRYQPRRLAAVADLLLDSDAALLAICRLDTPALQTLEALAVVSVLLPSGRPAKGRLAGFLGGVPDEQLDPLIARLEELGLAWQGRHGTLGVNPIVPQVLPACLGLGPSVVPYLEDPTVAGLKQIASRLGLGGDGRKQQIVERIVEMYRDPERMAVLHASAPDDVQVLLKPFIWDGPSHEVEQSLASWSRQRNARQYPADWALERGLLMTAHSYGGPVFMPMEVGFSLRGAGYTAPFDPSPPTINVRSIDPSAATTYAGRVALRVLDRLASLVEGTKTQPIPALKNEIAIGVREVRRLAKAHGCSTDEISLYLPLCMGTGLLDWDEEADSFVPGEDFDNWSAMPAENRLRELILTWWTLLISPLVDIDGKGKRANPFTVEPAALNVNIRRTVLATIGSPGDAAAVEDPGLTPFLEWQLPLIEPSELAKLLEAVLAEAALLGLVHDGGITPLGRALAPLDVEALAVACSEAVAGARSTVLFGADLTAVATGSPSPELGAFLDLVADREAHDSASIWRFSPMTVRRALDAGYLLDDLVADLETIAEQGIPQPLSYLVHDVARRYGELAVQAVVSCVIADDPALLQEIVVHRRLTAMKPRLLAPTVLASGLPPDDTIELLRSAGYFPASLADGTVRLRPVPAASRPAVDVSTTDAAPAFDPRAAARSLLGTSTHRRSRPTHGRIRDQLADNTPPLLGASFDLDMAVQGFGSLRIVHSGESVVLSDVELHGSVVEGWCERTQQLRRFDLSALSSMELVDP